MIPDIITIKQEAKKVDPKRPIIIITPVNRYIGFSASVSPVEQFSEIASKWKVPVVFLDPQNVSITISQGNLPVLYDERGEVHGSVYFPFGHTLLDRNMVRFIIKALEIRGEKVINGFDALTVADDKGLTALALSKSKNVHAAKSVITSSRSNSKKIIEFLKDNDNSSLVAKMTGFSAGGVGVQPIPANIDYLAPALWLSRMNDRPRVIQNDIGKNDKTTERTVIRSYIVGGKVVGSYTTKGYGIVNCAGLTRESKGEQYFTNKEEERILLAAAKAVYATGFCRIDSAGGKRLSIFEVNPLARIDAEKYGLNIPEEILWYAITLAHKTNN